MKRLLLASLLFSTVFSAYVEINYKESRVLTIPGLEKVIVYDNPQNIEIAINEEESILVTGLNPGKSKFIAIKESGKESFIVQVNPKPLNREMRQSHLDFSGKKFVSNFTAGYGRGDSKSSYVENRWNYGYMYYKLDARGLTPWGGFYGRVGIKNKSDFHGVYDFNARLDSEIGVFEVGDQYLFGKSTIVMPSQPLQGFSWSHRFSDLQVYTFLGRNNFGSWGSTLEREDTRGYNNLAYAKLQYDLDRFNQVGMNLSNKSYSLLYDWGFGEYKLFGELGTDVASKIGRDFKASYSSFGGLNGSLRYLHIDEGFSMPVGIENYTGYKGLKYNAYYSKSPLWDVAYNGETYLDLINSQSLFNQRDYINTNYYASKESALLPDFRLDYSKYRANSYVISQDNYEYQNESYQFKVYKDFNPVSVWYKFSPYNYENMTITTRNYKKTQHSVGFKVPFLKDYSYQFETTARHFDYSSSLGDVEYNRITGDYNEAEFDNFLIMNPIEIGPAQTLDGFYQLQSRYIDKSAEWKVIHYFMLQYLWYPNVDGKFAIRAYRRLNDEDDDLHVDSIIDELRIEYSQNFDYILRLGVGSSIITGIVYKDSNMNGIYDEGETGVPDVRVSLSDGKEAITNKSGIYTLRNVPVGDHTIYIDKKHTSILHTDDYPKVLMLDRSGRVLANFGILISGKIHGRAYVDIDDNGRYDAANDKPLSGVRIVVNKDVVKTDEDGLYSFNSDDYSEYTLKVDISSAPFSFALKSPRVMKMDGRGLADFVFKPRKNIEAIDRHLLLTDINENDDYITVEGSVDDQVVSLFINDKKVNISASKFRITVKKMAEKIKVKIFTKDKRSYIQKVEYN